MVPTTYGPGFVDWGAGPSTRDGCPITVQASC
jgi:hypothetical protein